MDPEGTDRTVLKYKCHTTKKLSMTRTLLTEKKEGEENIGPLTPFFEDGSLGLGVWLSGQERSPSIREALGSMPSTTWMWWLLLVIPVHCGVGEGS